MQVLLVKNIDRVGRKGQVIKVTEGYARNFLFRGKLAIPFTEGTKRHMDLMKKSWDLQEHKEKEAAAVLAEKIRGITLKITKKAGDKGRLFGSVTTAELAELLNKEGGFEIDKKHILGDHLKEVGKHEVTVRISGEVKSTFQVLIMSEDAATTPA